MFSSHKRVDFIGHRYSEAKRILSVWETNFKALSGRSRIAFKLLSALNQFRCDDNRMLDAVEEWAEALCSIYLFAQDADLLEDTLDVALAEAHHALAAMCLTA